jgi:hypothetical protein
MPKLMGIPDDVPVQIIAVKDAIENLRIQISVTTFIFVLGVVALTMAIFAVGNRIANAIESRGRFIDKTIRECCEIPTFGDK